MICFPNLPMHIKNQFDEVRGITRIIGSKSLQPPRYFDGTIHQKHVEEHIDKWAWIFVGKKSQNLKFNPSDLVRLCIL